MFLYRYVTCVGRTDLWVQGHAGCQALYGGCVSWSIALESWTQEPTDMPARCYLQ